MVDPKPAANLFARLPVHRERIARSIWVCSIGSASIAGCNVSATRPVGCEHKVQPTASRLKAMFSVLLEFDFVGVSLSGTDDLMEKKSRTDN